MAATEKPRSTESAPVSAPLDDPRGVWCGVIDALRQKRRTLAAVFEVGRVLKFTRAELEIGFSDAFELEQVRDPESMEAIKTLLAAALGAAPPRIRFTELAAGAADLPPSLSEERQKSSTEERERTKKGLSEHPNVQAAQEVLGAKLLEVRLQPR